MHKKISIITMHSSVNYGSVLQTYATNEVFKKLNCEAEFVDYTRANITDQAYATRMQKRLPIILVKRMSFGIFNRKINDIALKRVELRAKPMREFLNQYVKLTHRKYWTFEELENDPPEADIYCTGSDQVWNSIWNGGVERPYFLEYVPKGKKRIAYAASIGRDSIDDDEARQIRPYLEKYSAISMREISGVDLLKKMGIDTTWVIDPTLMLNRDEWLRIAEPIETGEKRFLLAYVLNWNDTISRYAKEIASQSNLEIIRICKSKIPRISSDGTRVVVVDQVGQLLSYFDKAAGVITDSFHATAFSLNFHKQLVVVPPERFSTRLESILKLTGTLECMVDNETIPSLDTTIDWKNVDSVLELERKKAFHFLEKAISE